MQTKMIEVIKFGAEWCGPCRMMEPTITQLMQKYNTEDSDVTVLDIDIDKNSELAMEYNIKTIPTMVFKKDGVFVEKTTGVKKMADIEEIIAKVKAN